MYKPKTTLLVFVCTALLSAESALAFRCGSKLVTEGAHISKVLSICGEPAYSDTRSILVNEHVPIHRGGRRIYRLDASGRYVTPAHGPFVQEITITEFTYNFGPSRLMRHLTFKNGYLRRIEELGYGHRERRY